MNASTVDAWKHVYVREYERLLTTAMAASAKEIAANHANAMVQGMRDHGPPGAVDGDEIAPSLPSISSTEVTWLRNLIETAAKSGTSSFRGDHSKALADLTLAYEAHVVATSKDTSRNTGAMSTMFWFVNQHFQTDFHAGEPLVVVVQRLLQELLRRRRDEPKRTLFYESVISHMPPHNSRDRTCSIANRRGRACCNPECDGQWGTGCWCCHSLNFAKNATEEAIDAHIAFLTKDEDSKAP